MVVSIGIPPVEAEKWRLPSAKLYRKGTLQFADVTIQESEQEQLCLSLADMILSTYQPILLREVVKRRYDYFTASEQKEIYLIAKSYQKRRNWQEVLANKLNGLLEQNKVICLEGFVRFRMEEYRKELEQTVDRAAEDYLVDREYKEFIGMLTCLAEIQPCLLEKANVRKTETGDYGIFDHCYRPVLSEEARQEFGALTPEDKLLSRLITLSPNEIIIHRKQEIENKELINTILNVFGEKVRFCEECSFCR